MLFNSLEFILFFPITVGIYYLFPRKYAYLWLLAASYFFYMQWNAEYALLMLFSTVITYLSGRFMERVKVSGLEPSQKNRYKKQILSVSLLLNLAVLFFYKYFNFGMELLDSLIQVFGGSAKAPRLDVLLPVGISFYTFQALGYSIDVYRDEIRAERNFFRYALFVSFFPQLVAGPIERSGNLLSQLSNRKPFCFQRAKEGLLLMLWGYFLKVVLADRAAIFVDCVYGNPMEYNGVVLFFATAIFSFQIYCDFYGYSSIAKGAAQCIGIELTENFRAPYLSTSIAEFWRNWHISLTSWFKDYVYFPLGGSRKGKMRKYLNKLVVFLVSGLWHGANLTFAVWGALNGIYQILEELAGVHKRRSGIENGSRLRNAVRCMAVFVLITLSWIFFRADSIGTAVHILSRIFSVPPRSGYGMILRSGLSAADFLVLFVCTAILLCADLCKKKGIRMIPQAVTLPELLQSLIIVGAICAILVFGVWGAAYDQTSFIYFQF